MEAQQVMDAIKNGSDQIQKRGDETIEIAAFQRYVGQLEEWVKNQQTNQPNMQIALATYQAENQRNIEVYKTAPKGADTADRGLDN
jgi:hypothetical protein